MKRTQMIVKRNVSEQMVFTVRISCSGMRTRSLMIVSPMHEENAVEVQEEHHSFRPLCMVEDLK